MRDGERGREKGRKGGRRGGSAQQVETHDIEKDGNILEVEEGNVEIKCCSTRQ